MLGVLTRRKVTCDLIENHDKISIVRTAMFYSQKLLKWNGIFHERVCLEEDNCVNQEFRNRLMS